MKTSETIRVLAALAQESRLDVFRYLIRQGIVGAPAGRIAADLGVHAATLSFHLNALKQAQLVEARRESRSIVYTANFSRVNRLIGFLTENCCRGEAAAGAAATPPLRLTP